MEGGGADLRHRKPKPKTKTKNKENSDVESLEKLFGNIGNFGNTTNKQRPARNPFELNKIKSTAQKIIALGDDDKMGIKPPRKKVTQPPRPPSQRAAAAAAKAAAKAVETAAKAVASSKAPKAPKATKAPKAPKAPKATVSKPKNKTIKPDKYDIIKRTYHDEINFNDKYINDLTDLIKRVLPSIPELKERLMSENENITDEAVKEMILEIHDSIYFQIRDEILLLLGLRTRNLSDIMEE